MKSGSNKMMGPGDAGNKIPSSLVCRAECAVIGQGTFYPGDKITDPEKIKAVVGNPNFSPSQEE